MSALRNVSVDAEQSTLTVGGGVRFLDVFDPVFDAGKEISKCRPSLAPSSPSHREADREQAPGREPASE